MHSTKPNLRDLVIAASVLLLALFLLLFPLLSRGEGKTVVLTYGDTTETYSLSENRTLEITSNGIHLTVKIEGGEVWVEDADCPDLVCLHSGKISKSGDVILCVPAGLRIQVIGGDNDVDFVAG